MRSIRPRSDEVELAKHVRFHDLRRTAVSLMRDLRDDWAFERGDARGSTRTRSRRSATYKNEVVLIGH